MSKGFSWLEGGTGKRAKGGGRGAAREGLTDVED